MKKQTPYFPDFHLPTLHRKPRTSQQKLADELTEIRQKNFAQLGEAFGRFVPLNSLEPSQVGQHSRRRLLSKHNTFWAFLGQVLSEDGSCQEVVHKLHAYTALRGLKLPSGSSAAYCKARSKLQRDELFEIFKFTSDSSEKIARTQTPWMGRNVIVMDGTGLSMPDTPENQKPWPQPGGQKKGCGFPLMKLVGCFSLETGALLGWDEGNKHDHDLPLSRKLWSVFSPGDISLGDRAFCSYYDIGMLKNRGVDSVLHLHQRRKPIPDAQAFKTLGKDDVLIKWTRPVKQDSKIPDEHWAKLPKEMILRQVKVTVEVPGFRTQEYYLVTTLLDSTAYPASSLAQLYFRRWEVELFFRHIKTTMGMDILRCKTPEMIRKEVVMNFLAYNCVRCLMYEAAEEMNVCLQRVSFKGTIEALRSWEPHLNHARISSREKFRLISKLYESIVANLVLERRERSEPRAKKRRAKNYQLMTKPRHEMRVPNHRNRNWENKGKKALS
jgi:hypothetical protein